MIRKENVLSLKRYLLFVCIVAGIFSLGTVLFPRGACGFEQTGPSVTEYPFFDERLSISFGLSHPFINTQLQVNRSNAVPGTFFDFETDLGFEGDEIRFFGSARYRVGKHESFDLTFLELARNSTKTLSKDVTLGDRTFSADTTVNAFLNTQYYVLTYQYSFVRNAFNELGASFGVNFANISTGLSRTSSFAGPLTSTGSARSKEVSFLAPVPLIGIYFSSQVLPKTFIRNAIQYLDVDIAGFSAKSLNYLVGVDYNPWQNFGVGIGVYASRLQIEKGSTLEGRFLYNITGTQVYVRYFL